MVDATQMGARASVLLVEDELLISNVAAEALEEQGSAVETVSNANDALLRIRPARRWTFCSPTSTGRRHGWRHPGAAGARVAAGSARHLYVGTPVRDPRIDPVDGAMFVPKPYDLFNLGRLLQNLIAAKRTRAGAFA
jgi:hypothetical protein